MPISHDLKTIFIHIPKNAGESIERTLGIYSGDPQQTFWGVFNNQYVLQHLTSNELRSHKQISKIWHEYFKFAVVRNPWSKAVSEYNWYLRYGPIIPFYEWVNSLESRIQINNSIHIYEVGHNLEQYKFVYDNNDNLIVDRLIRFENLDAEFASLCSEKNWEVELIKASTTASNLDVPFYEYYDRASALKISKIYARDIEKFGYHIEETFSSHTLKDKPIELDEFFDEKLYLDANPDVKSGGVDAFQHYLEHGIREQRKLR
jgi:hypothetical protein